MSVAEAQDIIAVTEEAFSYRREMFGEDLCDLIEPTLISDGMAGQTLDNDPDPIAENVECFIEEVSGGAAQIVVDGVSVIATHRVEMERSAAALLLTPHGTILVHAREGVSQRIFEQPVRTEESFMPIVEFKAILVKEGYRQPGIT